MTVKIAFYKDTLLAAVLAVPVYIWQIVAEPPASFTARSILSALIIAPVAEEIIFRMYLQRNISKWLKNKGQPVLLSVLAVSVMFALFHLISGDARSLLVFFPSMALGWHYLKHDCLAAVIMLHMFYNVTAFL